MNSLIFVLVGRSFFLAVIIVCVIIHVRHLFHHLAKAITQWQHAGEQLVVMGDWNEDITGRSLSRWMETFDLREAITTVHGTDPPQHITGGPMLLIVFLLVPPLKSIGQDI